MENNSKSLVTLITSPLIHQIQMAKTKLSQFGVVSYIFDANLDIVIGTSFIEHVKLKVNGADFNRAKEILKDVELDDN